MFFCIFSRIFFYSNKLSFLLILQKNWHHAVKATMFFITEIFTLNDSFDLQSHVLFCFSTYLHKFWYWIWINVFLRKLLLFFRLIIPPVYLFKCKSLFENGTSALALNDVYLWAKRSANYCTTIRQIFKCAKLSEK